MNKDEKEYYLRIINLQDSIIQALSQKNISKMLFLQKELESMQKSSFYDAIKKKKEERYEFEKKIRSLFSEIENVFKEAF